MQKEKELLYQYVYFINTWPWDARGKKQMQVSSWMKATHRRSPYTLKP